MRYTQLVEKVLMDFSAKLRKISKLVLQVLKFCDSDGKENPDGFLSHYLSLRILWPERFFDKLIYCLQSIKCGGGEKYEWVTASMDTDTFWA